MKKPEYEVIKLNEGLYTTNSSCNNCNPDCSSVCPGVCNAECVGYCEGDGGCPYD